MSALGGAISASLYHKREIFGCDAKHNSKNLCGSEDTIEESVEERFSTPLI
jgi:hypothetical protein